MFGLFSMDKFLRITRQDHFEVFVIRAAQLFCRFTFISSWNIPISVRLYLCVWLFFEKGNECERVNQGHLIGTCAFWTKRNPFSGYIFLASR